eukprot:CAMPEP_0114538164 /NCGR_PEP_ID=MMETSP0109-20121206/29985_1 /TAXON_ID=29199 /ORGANISM="Chlorarachnion reptans, Strain CCCM449" /LENGTH=859 /DNA_ID=CAMNT_0001722141 /DNA_START=192 /DNA_END=2768 /DNA_ORIENTATION=+
MNDEEDPAIASMRAEADYIGGVWIDGEFYAEGKRASRAQTKEEATYGVFGNFEDRNTRSSRIGSASLAKPMRFVGGNLYKSADVANKYREQDGPEDSVAQAAPEDNMNEDDEEPVEKTGLELRREQRLKREKERREREKAEGVGPKKRRPRKVKADREFASFQKLSGGLGLRMLQKMGYEGGALGKHGTGIVNPVKTKLRPQQMGLGYGGYKEKANMTQAELDGTEKPEKTRKQKVQKHTKNDRWKASTKKKGKKRVYKTVDELKEEAEKRATPELVIDMRGPHVRVTSLDKVGDLDNDVPETEDGWTPTGSASTLPELKWNMDALVEHTESEVHKTLDATKNAEKTAASLRSQRKDIFERVEMQKNEASNLESILDGIKSTRQQLSAAGGMPTSNDPLDPARILAGTFESLRSKYAKEFRRYNIERIAYALAVESLTRGLKLWRPLAKSAAPGIVTTLQVAMVCRKWDNALEDGASTMYEDLVQQTLMSPLTLALSSNPVREFADPILLLERIRPALPARVFHYLLTDVVGPRLRMEVSNWSPTRDRVPIHLWMHPWLDVLPKTVLDNLFALIRTKLSDALRGWKPKDASALVLIEPWHPVWSRSDMWNFLTRAIIPKLRALCVRDGGIPVNPSSENPEPFKAVVRWHKVVPHHALVSLLLNGFFPNWVRALHAWLQSPSQENKKKFAQIAKWYKGWKTLFPEPLLGHPVVEAQLRAGLNLMHAAISQKPLRPVLQKLERDFPRQQASLHEEAAKFGETGAGVDAAREAAAQRAAAKAAEASRLRAAAVRAAAGASGGVSFKEALERFAGRIGVEFMPNPKKGFREGCPVYTFGKCNIYFKGQSVYLYMPKQTGGGEW